MTFYINIDTGKDRMPKNKDFRNFRDLIRLSAENDQNILSDRIILTDERYYSSVVYIINEMRAQYQGDRSRLGRRFNFYELYRPLDRTEKLTVRLVRNRD